MVPFIWPKCNSSHYSKAISENSDTQWYQITTKDWRLVFLFLRIVAVPARLSSWSPLNASWCSAYVWRNSILENSVNQRKARVDWGGSATREQGGEGQQMLLKEKNIVVTSCGLFPWLQDYLVYIISYMTDATSSKTHRKCSLCGSQKTNHSRRAFKVFGRDLNSSANFCQLESRSIHAFHAFHATNWRSGWKAVLHICAAAAQDPALSEAMGPWHLIDLCTAQCSGFPPVFLRFSGLSSAKLLQKMLTNLQSCTGHHRSGFQSGGEGQSANRPIPAVCRSLQDIFGISLGYLRITSHPTLASGECWQLLPFVPGELHRRNPCTAGLCKLQGREMTVIDDVWDRSDGSSWILAMAFIIIIFKRFLRFRLFWLCYSD